MAQTKKGEAEVDFDNKGKNQRSGSVDRGSKKSIVYPELCGIMPFGSDCRQRHRHLSAGNAGLYLGGGGNYNLMCI